MNKEQFNNMQVSEQIQYINEMIQQKSLTKVCNDIGVNRSTITKRFKAKGFIYDKSVNLYQLNDSSEPLNDLVRASDDTTDINTLLNMIKALENRVQKLEQSNQATTVQQQNNNNKEIRFYKSNDLVVRAYKIDSAVQQRFKAYCEDNSQYKVSDIITTALENFLNDMEL